MPKKSAIVRRTRRRQVAAINKRRSSKLLSDKQVKNKTLSSRNNSAGLRVVKGK